MEKTEQPKWQTHHVTMPEDKALEYLDDLLKLVNQQLTDPGYPIALSMATDALRRTSDGSDNEPLAVEELQGMDGQPVWCKEFGMWALVYIYQNWVPHLILADMSPVLNHPANRYTLYRHRPAGEGERC